METLFSKYEIYKSDTSNDEIIKIIDHALEDGQHEYLIDIPIEDKRTLIGVINEHFKKGNENPFESLAENISVKDSYSGFCFLCYLDSYINFFCDKQKEKKWFDKLKDENKIDFEAIKKIKFDFDTLFNLYKNFDFKDFRDGLFGPFAFTVNEIKEINHMLSSHLTKDNIYNAFLEVLEKDKHALDNEFLNIMYISAYSFLPYDKQRTNQVLDLYLKEDQKIDFEFLALACGIFDLDETAKNKLMEHFDLKKDECYECSVCLRDTEEENAVSLIRDYIKIHPEKFEPVGKYVQKELVDIANEVKDVQEVMPGFLKKIKDRLYDAIVALPINSDKKDKLLDTVRNIKMTNRKKFIVEVLKAIGEILLVFPAIFGEHRGFKRIEALNVKNKINKILSDVGEIKKTLGGKDLT